MLIMPPQSLSSAHLFLCPFFKYCCSSQSIPGSLLFSQQLDGMGALFRLFQIMELFLHTISCQEIQLTEQTKADLLCEAEIDWCHRLGHSTPLAVFPKKPFPESQFERHWIKSRCFFIWIPDSSLDGTSLSLTRTPALGLFTILWTSVFL